MKEVPQVATLLDECIVKIAKTLRQEDLSSSDLQRCVDMLISLDKNMRDFKSTFEKYVKDMSKDDIEKLGDA